MGLKMDKEIYLNTKGSIKKLDGINFPELSAVEIELFLSLCLKGTNIIRF